METFAGRLAINPVIYAELCFPLLSAEETDQLVAYLGLKYREFSRESLFLAAQAYKIYRKRGGTKTAPLPDFFIGAHAAALGVPIITRDVTRYQTYFPSVTLIFDHGTNFHARNITTDTGWKITMDRGLDIFRKYETGPFSLEQAMQEARLTRGVEVTYLRV
jgi:predicted nucleic acid-binding protein